MVQAENFAELQCVEHKADVAVASEPRAVMLVSHLVAITHAVGDHHPVSAQIKNRRSGLGQVLRQIKIRRHVKSGSRLEMQILHREVIALHLACDHRFQFTAWRQRIEAQHLEQLPAIRFAARVPILQRLHFRQTSLRELRCLRAKRFHQHPVGRRLDWQGEISAPREVQTSEEKKRRDEELSLEVHGPKDETLRE